MGDCQNKHQLSLKSLIGVFLCGCLLWLSTGCSFAKIDTQNEPLPYIASLPNPKIPNWIESISPLNTSDTQTQVLIRFKNPLIPLEVLGSDKQRNLLKKFSLIPPIPGEFHFLTPKMIGFSALSAFPTATRFQVTLKAGLEDLEKNRLDSDLAWTFNTPRIAFKNLSGKEDYSLGTKDNPLTLKPVLEFDSNTELDLKSIENHAFLSPEKNDKKIPFTVILKERSANEDDYYSEETEFDPSINPFTYQLKPKETLVAGTSYNLQLESGIKPKIGNLATDKIETSKVITFPAFTFKKMETVGKPDQWSANSKFDTGTVSLQFNNQLDTKTIANSFTISPTPKEKDSLWSFYPGDSSVIVNSWVLEPNTQYTITIKSNLKDIYGQSLGKSIPLKFNTGKIAPNIVAPVGFNIFPSEKNLHLDVQMVNLPEKQYQIKFKPLTPQEVGKIDLDTINYSNQWDILQDVAWKNRKVSLKNNNFFKEKYPIKKELENNSGVLAYAITAKTNTYLDKGKTKWREPIYQGVVQLTNLGVFAQWFPDRGMVKVNHLSDGLPVKNAEVEIFRSTLDKKYLADEPCVKDITNEKGILDINNDQWKQCLNSDNESATELFVVVKENNDWAFIRTRDYDGSYGYGVDMGWDYGVFPTRGTIISDRDLYQPSETVHFTAFAYYLNGEKLQKDTKNTYSISLFDPDGKETKLGQYKPNPFGTFSFNIPLEKNQKLGYYYLTANSGDQSIYGQFRVAQFRPPNFKTELTLEKPFAEPNQKVQVTVNSNYLFGAPVSAGKVEYNITRQPSSFIPKGWEEYQFSRQWFYPEEKPELSSEVLQTTSELNSSGSNQQTITIDSNIPYPLDYRIDATVKDVANIAVSGFTTLTVFPDTRLIGLKSNFVGEKNKPFPIEIIVTTPEGKSLSGETIKLELQRIEYSNVTEIIQGQNSTDTQVKYTTVDTQTVTSKNNAQTVTFTPQKSGVYRIRANFANSKQENTVTDTQVWISGSDNVFWGENDPKNKLEIKLDKTEYQIGDTVTAIIQSPYPSAELYLAVIRKKPLLQTIQQVKGSTPTIQFKVTPEMLPNVAVEAILTRTGTSLNESEIGNIDQLMRIGFAPFNVNLKDRYLNVKVTPLLDKIYPGKEQTVTLELTDSQNNPVKGQFTVMVVNEAILQLTGYRVPDLVPEMYSDIQITTRFNDNRSKVILASPAQPLPKGWGYGGGMSSGIGDTRIRKNFQPIAYYNGSVISDDLGTATLDFTLPDDFTTWRVMVVATDGNYRFGNGDNTFMTTQPLISNPIFPQFLREGDTIMGGVAVTNTSDTEKITLEGYLSPNLKAEETLQLETNLDKGTKGYRFPIVAEQVGEGKVQFVTESDSGKKDAWEIPLEVKPLLVSETVTETGVIPPLGSGNIREGTITIPLNIEKRKLNTEVGGLTLSLSSTFIPEVLKSANSILETDDFPFLEPLASQLLTLSNLTLLSEKYSTDLSNLKLETTVENTLNQLMKLKHPSGGFVSGDYAREKADPFLSTYTAQSLAQAQKAGYTVNATVVKNLQKYLRTLLTNPSQYDWCSAESCMNKLRLESLIALDQLGETRDDFLPTLYQYYKKFDLNSQVRLIGYLDKFTEWKSKIKPLFEDIQKRVYVTGQNTTVNAKTNYSWYSWLDSATVIQSNVLELFISQKRPNSELDGLVKTLLAMRQQGNWGNSYNNAHGLSALTVLSNYYSQTPNFTANVKLGWNKVADYSFKDYKTSSVQKNLTMEDLPKGKQDLVISKKGQGELHYVTEYKYRLKGKQNGRFNGLRITRYLRPANQTKVLEKYDLYPSDKEVKLPVGQVFDIDLEITTDHPVHDVLITDYLPAGLEAVDTSFNTASQYYQAQESSWNIDFQRLYFDKITAMATSLNAGVYHLHYLVRSTTLGKFDYPGAEIQLQYAPEEFGRSTATQVEIIDPDS